MRLILFSALILFSSCSAQWHLKRAIQKGLKPSEKTSIVHDTLYVDRIHDSIRIIAKVDTFKVEKDCDELQKAKTTISKNKAIDVLQKDLCPKASIDTTYQMPVTIQEKHYDVPVTVKISSLGGKIDYSIEMGKVKIPFVKSETSQEFTAQYGVKWYWVLIALAAGIILGFGGAVYLHYINSR